MQGLTTAAKNGIVHVSPNQDLYFGVVVSQLNVVPTQDSINEPIPPARSGECQIRRRRWGAVAFAESNDVVLAVELEFGHPCEF